MTSPRLANSTLLPSVSTSAQGKDSDQHQLSKQQCDFIHLLASKLVQHGRLEQGLTLVKATLALRADCSNLWKFYAYANLLSGLPEAALQAVDTYQRLSDDNIDCSPINLIAARAYHQLGQKTKARDLMWLYLENGREPT